MQSMATQKKNNTGVVKQGVNQQPRQDPTKAVGVVHKKPPTQDKIVEDTNAALQSARSRVSS